MQGWAGHAKGLMFGLATAEATSGTQPVFTSMIVMRLLCTGDAPLVLGLDPATGAMERYIGLDVSLGLLGGCCRRVALDTTPAWMCARACWVVAVVVWLCMLAVKLPCSRQCGGHGEPKHPGCEPLPRQRLAAGVVSRVPMQLQCSSCATSCLHA